MVSHSSKSGLSAGFISALSRWNTRLGEAGGGAGRGGARRWGPDWDKYVSRRCQLSFTERERRQKERQMFWLGVSASVRGGGGGDGGGGGCLQGKKTLRTKERIWTSPLSLSRLLYPGNVVTLSKFNLSNILVTELWHKTLRKLNIYLELHIFVIMIYLFWILKVSGSKSKSSASFKTVF